MAHVLLIEDHDLRRRQSALPIIAISGGRRLLSPEFNLATARVLDARGMLAKPFIHSELQAAVSAVLP